MFFASGYHTALLYEQNNAFHHSAPCLAYYQAVSEGMNFQDVQTIPKDMNRKGYDALCRFFKGQVKLELELLVCVSLLH